MSLKDLLEVVPGSRQALAAAIGVHPVTLCSWQRGASLPPRTRYPALAASLGMGLEELAALVDHERQKRREKAATEPIEAVGV
jgi:DNA-binding transcriptional regulator YdaS (Cro superfamily)